MIKIPVMGSEAWDIYKENWYQIDAPRHYFLFTPKAMVYACETVGLTVEKVMFSSSHSQYIVSKLYRDTNLSLEEILKKMENMPTRYIRKYSLKSIASDKRKKGDMATFIIKHTKEKGVVIRK